MTEEEAKTKWCPHARVCATTPRDSSSAHNRTIVALRAGDEKIHLSPNYAHCIGSDCMAWRWRLPESAHGYCGLAGGAQ